MMRARAMLLVFATASLAAGGGFSACSCQDSTSHASRDAGAPRYSGCETAADCAGDLVCDPATGTCDVVGCSSDGECGAGAVCDGGGQCVENVPGGHCEIDANCVGDETCRAGTCAEVGSAGDACDSAEDCVTPLICDPGRAVCADPAACVEHADCGDAAHCSEEGTCERSGPESPCDTDAQCAEAERCLGVLCIPDACEGEAFAAQRVPANVMISIDRSGSMNDDIGSDGSKWDVARDAVNELMQTSGNEIRFGLNLFPGTNQSCSSGQRCGAGVVSIDIDADTAADISDYIGHAGTCSYGTPIAEDLQMLRGYAGLQDPQRNNYVLLVTDGQATCEDPVPQVAALYAQDPSVETFVVGFGRGVDPEQLADMAEAGGTARAGAQAYYQADDAASLSQAFADIAGSVLGCEYMLDGVAEDPDLLLVYFNGQRVPRDPSGTTGWDFNPATGRLTFAGNACTALRHGIVTDLTIAYGCTVEQHDKPDGGTGVDSGRPPRDAGGGGCTDRCDPVCGVWACFLPAGECGPCTSDADCCPNSLCLIDEGVCLPISG